MEPGWWFVGSVVVTFYDQSGNVIVQGVPEDPPAQGYNNTVIYYSL